MKVGMVLCLNEKREQAVADMTGRVWWALCVSKGCILNAWQFLARSKAAL